MFDLDRFKELCKERGVKQSILFSMVGRPRTYGSDLVKVKHVPQEYIAVWAEALGTTPAYLLGETDEKDIKKEQPPVLPIWNEQDAALLEKFHKLSPAQQELLLQLLEGKE